MALPDLAALHALQPAQQPSYPDRAAVDAVVRQLQAARPLVFASECDELTDKLAAVTRGEAFLLQGGDCAETFAGVTADNTRNKLRVLLQMAVVLTYAASVPVVKLGRLAGQYAKPRSSDSETREGVTLPAYRGDAVNGFDFTPEARIPDPARLLEVHRTSAATLSMIRAFIAGGYADLRKVHHWNTDFVAGSPAGQRYEQMAHEIDRAMAFMAAIGADPEEFHRVDFHISHEALVLEYEHAMTRTDARTQQPYDLSGHFLWIGERTRQLDGAHVEFLRGVGNPIGVKIGPTTTADYVLSLCEALNPKRVPGRLTLISRMGDDKVETSLRPLLRAVREAGHPVVWACDPMHANTFTADNGRKTRHFDSILREIVGFVAAHRAEGTWPGGIHIELTG
uniref:3-deoxy-7-phosphoheptulonate synthase class II n=1 Tax=Nocardioides sp. TaxID=35761 RepID=UPI003514DFD8